MTVGRGSVLVAAVLGSGVVFLDGTIVNVALETIGEDLPASVVGRLEGLTYVTSGYLAVLAALLILSGALGDRYGRRRVFSIGLVGFAVTSVACGLAPTLELLVVARLTELEAGKFLEQARMAAEHCDWDTIQKMIAEGKQRFADHPWVMEVLEGMAEIAKENLSRLSGGVTMVAILFIIVTALAGLSMVVVNALAESAWGTFTILLTIPLPPRQVERCSAPAGERSGTTARSGDPRPDQGGPVPHGTRGRDEPIGSASSSLTGPLPELTGGSRRTAGTSDCT